MAVILSELRQRLTGPEPSFGAWAKPSAVMVLLAQQPQPSVLLIHRPDTLTHHAGQIACPGGRFDVACDKTLWDAARRETEEEVGISVPRSRFAGFLDPVHIRATGYTLAPVVAVIDAPQVVRPNPDEVASYQWVRLDEMRAVRQMSRVMAAGVSYRLPEFPLAWGRLWGATARVMDQLLSIMMGLSGTEAGVRGGHSTVASDG